MIAEWKYDISKFVDTTDRQNLLFKEVSDLCEEKKEETLRLHKKVNRKLSSYLYITFYSCIYIYIYSF